MSEKYEALFAFRVNSDEEAQKALLARFTDLIAQNGTIDSVDEWGKRRLAYEIDDELDGYYVLINFTSEPSFPAELERISNITDGVLRSLVIKKPDQEER